MLMVSSSPAVIEGSPSCRYHPPCLIMKIQSCSRAFRMPSIVSSRVCVSRFFNFSEFILPLKELHKLETQQGDGMIIKNTIVSTSFALYCAFRMGL